MGKRRFTQLSTDDDGNDGGEVEHCSSLHNNDDDGEQLPSINDCMEEDEKEDTVMEPAKPIGKPITVSGKGRCMMSHYQEFRYNGLYYQLEDSILLASEGGLKPQVAIIKDISVDHEGSMHVIVQWFYQFEEVEKHGGGNWQSLVRKGLFYSFHRDEVPVESVMHKCVVHFIPSNKQIPRRTKHPGFVVQYVYCTEQRRLFKLIDKDYEVKKQKEIDLLVQKTMSRLGDLPDVEPADGDMDHDDQFTSERLLQNRATLDVSREEEGVFKSAQSPKAEVGFCPSNMSEYYAILFKFSVLTGDSYRDNRLEKLLQVIHGVCTSADGKTDGKAKNINDVRSPSPSDSAEPVKDPANKRKDVASFRWPDSAVPAVASLENAANKAFASDYQMYNQKMRQMTFNLKHNAVLSRRFLNGDLEPLQILYMTPDELKQGLTAEEMKNRQPKESQHLQMIDARCRRCSMKEVGLRDIIQAGRRHRYQLECSNCGNIWYASPNEAATLTIGGSSCPNIASTTPLATTKFEDVEKALAIKCKTEKPHANVM